MSSFVPGSAAEPVQVFVRLRPEFGDDAGGGGGSSATGDNVRRSIQGQLSNLPKPGIPMQRRSVMLPQAQSQAQTQVTLGAHASTCVRLRDAFTLQIVAPGDSNSSVRKTSAAVDDKIFAFDRIFAEDATQEKLYESVSEHVQATVKGYNTTIFAYGSTGSGKSHTMTGNSSAPGIIPRAISEIFSIIQTTAAQEPDVFFYVRLSYVELYNNSFRNLLEFASKELGSASTANDANVKDRQNQMRGSRDDHEDDPVAGDHAGQSHKQQQQNISPSQIVTNRGDKIEVRESAAAGVFLAGPNIRIPVTTAHEAFQLIARGNKTRAVAATQCNDFSSRSHAILTLHVESRVLNTHSQGAGIAGGGGDQPGASELRLGKMHLVDLAGSERVKLSGAEGDTLIESQNINLSLSALGDVLSALSRNASILSQQEQGGNGANKPSLLVPVPYRNSKLTHLLKDSLGGNSKTIMIANVRTLPEYYQQTAVTLMYAARAKKVRNKSLVNRNVVGDTGIQAVTMEIERLRSRLDERSSEFNRLREAQLRDAQENSSLKTRLYEMNRANETEKKQLEAQLSNIIHSQAGQLANQTQKISLLQQSLQVELAKSQNRIAEQEKEIKWLKKALDESEMTASQPLEKLERMQKVVEALQEQAHYNKQQIAFSENQIVDLKADLDQATNELVRCQEDKRLVEREKDALENSANDSSSKCADLEVALKRCKADVDVLQEMRLADLEKAAVHIRELEKERSSLRDKLSSTVSALEQQMDGVLQEASNRIKQAEAAATEAQANLLVSGQDSDLLRSGLVEARDSIEELQRSNKELSKDVKDLTRQLHEERKALEVATSTSLVLETTVHELNDKIKQLNATCNAAAESIVAQRSDLEADLTAKALEIATLRKGNQELQMAAIKHQKQKDALIQVHHNNLEEALENLRRTAAQELLEARKSTQENADSSAELERKLKSQIDVEIQRANDAATALKQAEEELSSMRSHGLAMEREFTDKLAALEGKHRESSVVAAQAAADAIQQVEVLASQKLKQSIKDLEDGWLSKLKAAECEYMENMHTLRRDFDELRERELTQLRDVLEQEHKAEIDELRVQVEREKSKAIETLRDHCGSTVQELTEAHQNALLQLDQRRAEELTTLEDEYIAAAEASAHEIEERLRQQAAAHEQATNDTANAHQQRVVEISAQMDRVLEAERAAAKTTLQLALDGERQELQEQHALLLRSVQQQHADDLETARCDLEASKKVVKGLEQQLVAIKDQAKEVYESQKTAMEALQMHLDEEHDQALKATASAQHFQASCKALEEQLDITRKQSKEVAEANKRALENLENAHEERLESALRGAETATESTLRAEFKTAMSELRAHHASDRAELEKQHVTQHEMMEQQLSVARNELQDLAVEVRRKAAEDLALEKARIESHAAELERLTQEHSRALETLEAAAAEARDALLAAHKIEVGQLLDACTSLETALKDESKKLHNAQAALEQQRIQASRNADEAAQIRQRLDNERAILLADKIALQAMLDESQEAHKALSTERKQLESSHDKLMAKFTEELAQAQDRCAEVMASAASRQGQEAKAIRDQRQEFETILQSSLFEREAHYKQALKQLEDNFELDRQLLQGNQERTRARHEAEFASLTSEHETVNRRLELASKERLAAELARADERHAAALEAAMDAAAVKHKQEVATIRSENAALEQQLQQAISAARVKHEEMVSAQSKQRAEYEASLENEIRTIEARQNTTLAVAESSFQSRENRLQSLHAQQCKALEQESEAAVSAAVSEERAAALQRLAAVKETHRVELQELQSRAETRAAADRRTLETQHAEALRSAYDEMRAAHATEIAALESRLVEERRKHTDAQAKWLVEANEARVAQEKAYELRLSALEDDAAAAREALSQLKRRHVLELDELRGQLSDEMRVSVEAAAEHRQAIRAEAEERLNKSLLELRERLQAEHAESTATHERQAEERLNELLADAEERRVAAETSLASLRVEASSARERIDRQTQEAATLSSTLEQLTKQRQQELETLSQDTQGAVRVLTEEHERQKTDLNEKHAALLLAQEARERDIVTKLEAQIAALLSEVAQAQQAQVQLKLAVDQAAQSGDSEHSRLASMLSQEQAERARAAAAAERTQQSLESQISTLRDAQKALSKENAFLQNKLRDLEGAFKELESMDAASTTAIEQGVEQARSRFQAEAQAAVQEQAAAMAKVQARLDQALSALAAAEAKCAAMQSDRDQAQEALGSQQTHLQGDYLALLQKQTESLLAVVEAKNQQQSLPQIEEMEGRFLALVKNLPQLWKQAYGGEGAPLTLASMDPARNERERAQPFPTFTAPPQPPAAVGVGSRGRVPLHLLVNEGSGGGGGGGNGGGGTANLHRSSNASGSGAVGAGQTESRQPLPWTSPTLRSSPTDQLVAAILDGDVQGVRAVVRSKGEDLNSVFWKDLARSVLPLHRAVSGLHFHGSERLLVATIEALTQLGADVNATDQAGNTVLHKAVQVCTSKSIGGVVQTLLQRGANASSKNRNGDSPLHLECDRLRSASVDVISQLIKAGASPSSRNSVSGSSKPPLSPLTIALLRGAKMTAGIGSDLDASSLLNTSMSGGANASENIDPSSGGLSMSGRGVWIRAAELLVSSGASWDTKWRSQGGGASQLHLLFLGFPAPPQHAAAYRALVASALDAGLSPLLTDVRGSSSLIVLCERMAAVSADSCPDAARVMRLLLDVALSGTATGALPQELLTAVDALPQSSAKSCLALIRPMLSSGSSLGVGSRSRVR